MGSDASQKNSNTVY